MDEKVLNEIKNGFKGKILKGFEMSKLTSLKIGGRTEYLFYPECVDSVKNFVKNCKKVSFPFVTLGFGTNVLVLDRGIGGVVLGLKNVNKYRVTEENEKYLAVYADAGASLAKLVNFVSAKGYSGFEFASNIPGSIGGALMMNAGAYGSEIGKVVKSVTFLNKKGNLRTRKREKLNFEYRNLNEPDIEIITGGEFVFYKDDKKKILKRINDNKMDRKSKQPWGVPTAGSVFKNPEGDYAGRLIEAAGLKGHRIGNAGFSDVHANFIVNYGGAKASDVIALISLAMDRVERHFDIRLEPEIKIIGEE